MHDTHHLFIAGSSGQAKSLLNGLTDEEQAAMTAWSASQRGDPGRGGAIDLMQWPGWSGVMDRRFKERFSAKG